MHPTRALVASALLALAACSADSGPSASPAGTSRSYAASAREAFARHDTPYEQVLAESRSTGRPALLYFWAAW